MHKITGYDTEKFGHVYIQRQEWDKGKMVWQIWWDFLEENEPYMIESNIDIDLFQKYSEDVEFPNFDDVPNDGIFKDFDGAYEYATEKFGELLEN